MFTDLRAQKIDQVMKRRGVLMRALQTATPDQFAGIAAALQENAIDEEEARQLPAHTYQCIHKDEGGVHETFESPARLVLAVVELLDHNEEGAVTRHLRFREPRYITLCPDCKVEIDPEYYLEGRWK
jgi:hypothetical protein